MRNGRPAACLVGGCQTLNPHAPGLKEALLQGSAVLYTSGHISFSLSPSPRPQPRFTPFLRHSTTSHQVTRSPFKATLTKEVNNYGGALVPAKLSSAPSVPRGEASSRVLDSSWSKWSWRESQLLFHTLYSLPLVGFGLVFFFSVLYNMYKLSSFKFPKIWD